MVFKGILENLFGSGKRKEGLPVFTLAKMRLAAHPNTKPETLKRLSKHDCHHVVVRVAENLNTSCEVLEELVMHKTVDVRVALSENSKSPLRVLLLLAQDVNPDVRHSLAENHNIPLVLLNQLCQDENPYVAFRARKTLERLLRDHSQIVASFPSLRQIGRREIG